MGDDQDMLGCCWTTPSLKQGVLHGRSQSEVEEEMRGAGVLEADIERIAPHRTFPGGRPSTFMLGDRLNAEALGALVAAHEHKIFLEGVFWNVFSYDQWGVELGKALAKQLGSGQGSENWTPGSQALKASL